MAGVCFMTTVRDLMTALAALDPDLIVVGEGFGPRWNSSLTIQVEDGLRLVDPWGSVVYDAIAGCPHGGDAEPVRVRIVRLRFS